MTEDEVIKIAQNCVSRIPLSDEWKRVLAGRIAVSIKDALAVAPASAAEPVKVRLGRMPGYGSAIGNEMLHAVAEAIYGDRNLELLKHDIDDERNLGHQMVPAINFNSLSRIITAFVNGSTLAIDTR